MGIFFLENCLSDGQAQGGHFYPFCLQLFRNFHKSSIYYSHYDVLGLSPGATQNDIKSQYYKLSMMYHPDKNKGSEEAAKKFRDISTAYEILGNLRLKKLYDKGIIHTAGPQYSHREKPEVEEDDPQTKFYKSRMQRTEVPHSTGRTPIYDFDEWSKAHYGKSFDRKQAAKFRYEYQQVKKRNSTLGLEREFLIFGFVISIILFIAVFIKESTDIDKIGSDIDNVQDRKKSR